MEFSDIISVLALILSAFATWKTLSYGATQDNLNKMLLKKESHEDLSTKKADLTASIVKIGTNKHRLKIGNKGKCAAKNVMLEFPEGNNFVPDTELKAKLPLEILESFQSIELMAFVSMQTERKQILLFKWQDDFSQNNEKLMPVVF